MIKTFVLLLLLLFINSIKVISSIGSNSVKRLAVIGCGPTSLTLALAFEKLGYNIDIYEKRESLAFDANQAFLYLIDGRGQRILKELNVLDDVKKDSVSSYTFQNLTEIKANNEINILKLPTLNANSLEKYWVPRHQFINTLYTKVMQKTAIKVHFNSKLEDIYYDADELKLELSSSSLNTIKYDYIFGCDGVNSQVRNILINKFKINDDKNFNVCSYTSESTGLRYKIIPLQSNFKYNNITSISTTAYAIRSASTKPNQRLSLGLLPFTNNQPRTANIIVKKDHEIWKLKSYDDHLKFFEKSFPQLTILNNLINKEDLVSFSSSQGGVFPKIQYAKSLFRNLNNNKGIVLIGDAAHAFPPDLGQGVNSGLEDVHVIYNEMLSHNNNFDKALDKYEKIRLPDIKALCKIMVFGYPTQYKGIAVFKDTLWKMNFLMRFLLNKIAPQFFSLPAFILIQDESLSYSNILKIVNGTTRNIVLLFLSTMIALFGKRLLKSMSKVSLL